MTSATIMVLSLFDDIGGVSSAITNAEDYLILSQGERISNPALKGDFLVIKENLSSYSHGEGLPRYDIINLNDYSILKGVWLHHGNWTKVETEKAKLK
jgi:hypothetical protein